MDMRDTRCVELHVGGLRCILKIRVQSSMTYHRMVVSGPASITVKDREGSGGGLTCDR